MISAVLFNLMEEDMNFKTRLSYNNRVMFIYENGETRQTPFTEVSFFGDNYILAKKETDIFYTILDLDGNEKNNEFKVIHRFQNGLLLTYKAYKKYYKSSDAIEYSINYNIYSVLNDATSKQYILNIVQSDEIKEESEINVIQSKCTKIIIKHFLQKPLYNFNDFVFSEIFDNQYIITGNLLMTNPLQMQYGQEGDFDKYQHKKIWSVVDFFRQKGHSIETDIVATTKNGLTFKEAEFDLMDNIAMPEYPTLQTNTVKVLEDLKVEYKMYRNWRNQNRWQHIIRNILPFTFN